ncbi:cytochrome P450 [Aspergillus undulatus]|uniref:cytochrome P450 n=1 Tax=Aspergillus undulatus TaxID=1810928 RepID=UPI003CCE3042
MSLEHLIPVLAGTLSHIFYFRRGEHHLSGLLYLNALALITSASVVYLVYKHGSNVHDASFQVFCPAASYLFGLYTSLLVYRVFLHPLCKFPGPAAYRASSFCLSAQLGKKRDAFRHFNHLHKIYGPFVRVGPSELSIAHPAAVNAIYGAASKCTKAAWYDLNKPVISLHTMRERASHHARRRVWSAAFSERGLRMYEQRIRVHRRKLIDYLCAVNGKPVDVTKWFGLYSFDVMGDLAFGKGLSMLDKRDSEEHLVVQSLQEGLAALSFMPSVWALRLLAGIPWLARDRWRFLDFCTRQLQQRLQTDQSIPDIASAMLAPLNGRSPTKHELNLLSGESQLIVVAGSDTVATTLASILYELVRHPSHIEKLRQELAPCTLDTNSGEYAYEYKNDKIASLPHLNGIINEALRLHPPIPTALQRKTPPEGIEIGGTCIPGNMTVWCPQYVLGRDENTYSNPEAFIPERWYQSPHLIKDRDAFAPFSIGPYGCIGKSLALLNIRTMIAQLVMTFDISFGPGEDGGRFEGETTEQFTVQKGGLDLVFRGRG